MAKLKTGCAGSAVVDCRTLAVDLARKVHLTFRCGQVEILHLHVC